MRSGSHVSVSRFKAASPPPKQQQHQQQQPGHSGQGAARKSKATTTTTTTKARFGLGRITRPARVVSVQSPGVRTPGKKRSACNRASPPPPLPPPPPRLGLADADAVAPEQQPPPTTPPLPSSSAPRLSAQQSLVVREVVEEARSVFFTGCAGTGKSLVLHELRRRLPRETTVMTATTSFAACQIGGTTLHQFAGITPAMVEQGDGERVARSLLKRREVVKRWQRAAVLVVDEVSMLDAQLFELLELLGRRLRGRGSGSGSKRKGAALAERPFGGLQLVLCGDFFQLPPVSKRGEAPRRFCFECAAWRASVERTIVLKAVFRQRDRPFVQLLNRVRWGLCSDEDLALLGTRVLGGGRGSGGGGGGGGSGSGRSSSSSSIAAGDGATKLFTHTADVDRLNHAKLSALPGGDVSFRADDQGQPAYRGMLGAGCAAKESLTLRVGARVVLLQTLSLSEGLCNGARGTVLRFTADTGLPVVRFEDNQARATVQQVVGRSAFRLVVGDTEVASRTQIPLALAWAVSVHKSQGMSLSCAEIDLSRVFEYGQAYVALSRLRSLDGLVLTKKFDRSSIKAHPTVTAFYRTLGRQQGASKTPAVAGPLAEGGENEACGANTEHT